MNIKEWWAQVNKKALNDVLRRKQRLVVMDTETLKEKFSFQLSGINLFVAVGLTIIVFVALTTVLIAFTPLREYIPGYTNTDMVEQTYRNEQLIDSLQNQIEDQEWLIATIQHVLSGEPFEGEAAELAADSTATLRAVAGAYRHSRADSLLREEVEREDNRYQVKSTPQQSSLPAAATAQVTPLPEQIFFCPLKGTVVAPFEPARQHFGVDVAAAAGEIVKAVAGGTVVMANFTVESGHTLVILHPGGAVSVYKHNSSLLKHEGDVVRTGEPVAFVGNSGSLSTGQHLHFELWVNGRAVDPQHYVSF
ncbi:MAG: M23 family metallopeptidase [Bacteroidales bacterium]|nr:M23 family metallopeptidase [Bacteroidales bacterium]